MAQDFVSKRRDIATKAVKACSAIEGAASDLQQCALDLVQSGGSFQDTDFEGTDKPWLNSYNLNVLLTGLLVDLQAWLVAGTPKHDDVLRSIKTGI